MKSIIADPEQTEQTLKQAGFLVKPIGMAFEVYLNNRKVMRSEIATVLECDSNDLKVTQQGVLVS